MKIHCKCKILKTVASIGHGKLQLNYYHPSKIATTAFFLHAGKFRYSRDGEPIYYHGRHQLWIIAGGPQITIYFILKFYLYLTTRDRDFL